MFARIFRRNGFDVVITGPRSEKGHRVARKLGVAFESDNRNAARRADIVIITVPIGKTLEVIKEVAPVMRKGQLITDLTSVKKEPCRAMDEYAPDGVEVLGCHPVFGPMARDFRGQNFVLCPVRTGELTSLLKDLLKKEGAKTIECSPEEHDRAMGLVQGMTHFMLISAGMAIRDLHFRLDDTRGFASPVYQLVLDLIGRILGQDPRLYAEIQMNNPETKRIRGAYLRAAERLDEIISRRDENAFIKEMTKAAENFGDTGLALERTQRILEGGNRNED